MNSGSPHHDSAARQTATLSWLNRLRYTPLTDALRGELTARWSVAYTVDRANLPAPLPGLIMLLLRRTKLWHRERLDVARELITHFQDGLDAGVGPEQLATDFGDITQAAALIRRAKKRNRPLWWRSGKRSLQGVMLLPVVLLVIYGFLAIRFFAGAPSITRDYLADLNEPAAAVPQEERAWPRYRQALLAMPELADMIYQPQQPARLVVKPGDEDWATFDDYAAQHAAELELVRRAAAMPGLGYQMRNVLDDEDRKLWPEWDGSVSPVPMISVRLPFRELRMLIVLLEVESQRAAREGHSQRVVDNLAAVMGIVRHTRENQTYIGDLVALAHFQAMLDRIREWLAEQPELFTDAQLQELAHRLAKFDDRVLRLRLDGERLFFYDIVQRIYTDDGRGDGRITHEGVQLLNSFSHKPDGTPFYDAPPALATPAFGLLVLNRKALLAEYDKWMDAMERNADRPLWLNEEVGVGTLLPMWAADPIQQWRYLPLVRLLPAIESGLLQHHYVRGSRDGVVTAIALELYRRQHGEWPQLLDDLVPMYLPAPPLDRFDGKWLRYQIIEGKPRLYSIGADRKDDGGVPAANPSPNAWQYPRPWSYRHNSGDWVLWPPMN